MSDTKTILAAYAEEIGPLLGELTLDALIASHRRQRELMAEHQRWRAAELCVERVAALKAAVEAGKAEAFNSWIDQLRGMTLAQIADLLRSDE